MSFKENINAILKEKNPQNEGDLYQIFKRDLDSFIVALDMLGWSKDDYLKELDSNRYYKEDLIERFDKYFKDFYLANLLIPKTTQCAVELYLDLKSDSELFDFIVMMRENDSNYLSELINHKLLNYESIIFDTEADLRSETFLEDIHNKIISLDAEFREEENIYIIKKFKLIKHLEADPFSRDTFEEIVKAYQEDAVYPITNTHRLIFKEDKILYSFQINVLKNQLLINSPINFKKASKKFVKDFKNYVQEETLESTAKFVLTSSLGLSGIDVGIASVRILLSSIVQSNEELSDWEAARDVKEFKKSGKEDVKSWYFEKIKERFLKAMEDSNIVGVDVPEQFLIISYEGFIERYFQAKPKIRKNHSSVGQEVVFDKNLSHTELVILINSYLNNLAINLVVKKTDI